MEIFLDLAYLLILVLILAAGMCEVYQMKDGYATVFMLIIRLEYTPSAPEKFLLKNLA